MSARAQQRLAGGRGAPGESTPRAPWVFVWDMRAPEHLGRHVRTASRSLLLLGGCEASTSDPKARSSVGGFTRVSELTVC